MSVLSVGQIILAMRSVVSQSVASLTSALNGLPFITTPASQSTVSYNSLTSAIANVNFLFLANGTASPTISFSNSFILQSSLANAIQQINAQAALIIGGMEASVQVAASLATSRGVWNTPFTTFMAANPNIAFTTNLNLIAKGLGIAASTMISISAPAYQRNSYVSSFMNIGKGILAITDPNSAAEPDDSYNTYDQESDYTVRAKVLVTNRSLVTPEQFNSMSWDGNVPQFFALPMVAATNVTLYNIGNGTFNNGGIPANVPVNNAGGVFPATAEVQFFGMKTTTANGANINLSFEGSRNGWGIIIFGSNQGALAMTQPLLQSVTTGFVTDAVLTTKQILNAKTSVTGAITTWWYVLQDKDLVGNDTGSMVVEISNLSGAYAFAILQNQDDVDTSSLTNVTTLVKGINPRVLTLPAGATWGNLKTISASDYSNFGNEEGLGNFVRDAIGTTNLSLFDQLLWVLGRQIGTAKYTNILGVVPTLSSKDMFIGPSSTWSDGFRWSLARTELNYDFSLLAERYNYDDSFAQVIDSLYSV